MAIAGLCIGYASIVLSIFMVFPMLFVGARAWKDGSDRAACIMNQRNITMQVQNYALQHQLQPGAPIQIEDLLASDTDIDLNCPSGGELILSPTIPDDGVSAATCPNADEHGHVFSLDQ